MKEKRSLRNVSLTLKHHWTYLGQWVLLTITLIILLYSVSIHHLYSLVRPGNGPYIMSLMTGASLVAALLCTGIILLGVLTAHRIAGVHVKLRSTFLAIRDGKTKVRLRFRKEDKLDDLAEAFNSMMDTLLEENIEPPETSVEKL